MRGRLFLGGIVVFWVAGAAGMASALTLHVDSCKPSCQLQITRAEYFCGHPDLGNRGAGGPAVTVTPPDITPLIFSGSLDRSAPEFSSSLDNLGKNERPWPIPGGRFWLLASGLLGVAGLSQKFISRLCSSLAHIPGAVFGSTKNFIGGNRFSGVKVKSP